MLEQLFGSRTRVKLLRLFLVSPDTAFFVREITRKIDEQLNSVRRELANLLSLGLVTTVAQGDKKYYQLNKKFALVKELGDLLLKSQILLEQNFIKSMKETGRLRYLLLTGSFTGVKHSQTDVLIVGQVNKAMLVSAIERFQRQIGREINYTLLSTRDYNERRSIGDKFLLTVLNNPKVVVVDDLGQESKNE
ncbi:MAG: winged helix-turn-helix domain-containing protein [Patescibacteria group bacterium]